MTVSGGKTGKALPEIGKTLVSPSAMAAPCAFASNERKIGKLLSPPKSQIAEESHDESEIVSKLSTKVAPMPPPALSCPLVSPLA